MPAVVPAKAGDHENIENNPMHSSGMIDTYEKVADHDSPYGPNARNFRPKRGVSNAGRPVHPKPHALRVVKYAHAAGYPRSFQSAPQSISLNRA